VERADIYVEFFKFYIKLGKCGYKKLICALVQIGDEDRKQLYERVDELQAADDT